MKYIRSYKPHSILQLQEMLFPKLFDRVAKSKLQFINSLSAVWLMKTFFPWNCHVASYGWVSSLACKSPIHGELGHPRSLIGQLRDAVSDSCSVKFHSMFSLGLRWPGHNPNLSHPSPFHGACACDI